jgi:hypothetical protein
MEKWQNSQTFKWIENYGYPRHQKKLVLQGMIGANANADISWVIGGNVPEYYPI